MAYKVSQEVISLFKSCYRQIAKIQVLGVEGLDEIKETDIVQGGLTVDRYCFSSNSLEIGTAIASELSLELKNDKGQFDSFSFDGVKLIARIGIKKWDAKTWENAIIHYVPLGVFTVDEPIKNKATVTLNALDNMVKFDRPYDTDLIFPATLGEIAEDACSKCGVLLKTTSFYNSDYVVSSRPTDEELTYRQVIQWVAQLSCTNAFVDWDGQLRFAWFEDSGITIPPSDRYDSDLEEDSVLITGVKVVTTDDSEYTAGSDDCIFVIEGNSLAQSNPELIASTIYAQLENFSYRPYSCECRPMPYLFPMDMITFIDTKGNEHKTIVSAVTYTMNSSTDVLGEGDGQTKGGYASTGSVTQHEKVIIEKAKKAAEKTSTEQFNVALSLNETIGSAFGLYRTEIVENAASTWYYHDKSTLEDSTIIYVFNSGGFAWTDDWNDGEPIWQYGFTKDGNALYKILSAYKIQTELLEAECITAEKISAAYKKSVTDEINKKGTEITQSFVAADGKLDSRITAEVTRATDAESSLSSRITQTATDITAEVTRATEAEGNLSSRITTNAESITAEVTRATDAESSLSSRITLQDDKISLVVSEVDGKNTIAAASIVTAINEGESSIKISADHIELTGSVTVIASKSDIPTKTSQLTNNSNFTTLSTVNTYLGTKGSTTYNKVVSIIDGTVTADFIEAIGITANALTVTDTSGNVLLGAGDNKVDIAGFSVSGDSFTNVDSDGFGVKITNESLSVSKLLTIATGYDVPMSVELSGLDGLMTISTYPIPGNDYYTYVPLMKFVAEYSDPFGTGDYLPTYRYICVRQWNGSSTWSFCITSTLDFPNRANDSVTTV